MLARGRKDLRAKWLQWTQSNRRVVGRASAGGSYGFNGCT
jgi:hypothetical protein